MGNAEVGMGKSECGMWNFVGRLLAAKGGGCVFPQYVGRATVPADSKKCLNTDKTETYAVLPFLIQSVSGEWQEGNEIAIRSLS